MAGSAALRVAAPPFAWLAYAVGPGPVALPDREPYLCVFRAFPKGLGKEVRREPAFVFWTRRRIGGRCALENGALAGSIFADHSDDGEIEGHALSIPATQPLNLYPFQALAPPSPLIPLCFQAAHLTTVAHGGSPTSWRPRSPARGGASRPHDSYKMLHNRANKASLPGSDPMVPAT